MPDLPPAAAPDPLALDNCPWCASDPCRCARCRVCGAGLHSDHEQVQGYCAFRDSCQPEAE